MHRHTFLLRVLFFVFGYVRVSARQSRLDDAIASYRALQ